MYFSAFPCGSTALTSGTCCNQPELKENLANHMAHVHASVTAMSTKFLEAERRNNYVTPKSFLELIALYKVGD
eukprot:SAG22_NODE_38_length_26325_cov_107.302067_32_plen_73_part_00